ncbi:MAG: TonB-dependent receptor [Candidatus Omnitrophica bacterium]|nr:TonB-dependent receptor [Candidatus Omnitrophota bacterium]
MFCNRSAARFLVALSVVLGTFVFSYADDVDLEKIVVTPYRYGESLAKTAADVTVVTKGDIEGSNSHNVVDVFRSIPGVTVRDYFGNGTQATVDIGGFGEQGPLNVLVLVDGRRANNVDLSGVNWNQIPLDEVERIEVVRGGSGAVLYGDNASSGVVNIITKKGSGKPKVELETEYGSYDMNKEKLSLGGKVNNKLSYWFSLGRDSTNGYRNNSFNKDSDFASKIAYDFNDMLSAHFDSGFHASTYGLPGALFQSDIDQHSRRYARFGNDHANGKDYYFVLGPKLQFLGLGNLNLDFSYRQNDVDSYYLTSNHLAYRNSIETFGMTPKYTLDNSIFNHDNKFIAGLDFYRSLYSSRSCPMSDDSTVNQYTDIHKNSLGSYLQDEFSILKQLTLVGGYRHEFADYTFAYHDNTGFNPDQDTKVKFNMDSFNSGLTYTYKDDSNVFLNVNRSFRFPEVDEFTYMDATSFQTLLNTDLKPQSSIDYQIGLRHKFSDRFKGNLSLFRMNVKNELYLNATDTWDGFEWNSKNENYDRTVHEGLESSLDAKLNDWVTLFGNYTFTNAYFDGGQYSGSQIPLVSKHKGSVGLKFALPMDISLNIIGTYLGPRYYLNDQANAYSKLNGYMVADTNLSWHCKDFKVTFGINNLFDKQYSEYAGVLQGFSVGHAVGDKFYYPNPGRNFSLKVNYTF